MDARKKLQQIIMQNGFDKLEKNLNDIIDDFLIDPLNDQEETFDECITSIIKCIHVTENELSPIWIRNIKSDTGEVFDANVFTALTFSMGSSKYNDLMLRFKVAINLLQFKDSVKLVFTDEKVGVFYKEHRAILADIFETIRMINDNTYETGIKIAKMADTNASKFAELLSDEDNKRKFIQSLKKDVEDFCKTYTKEFRLTYLK